MKLRAHAVVTGVAAVLAVGIVLFVGANMLSSRKARIAREGWDRTLGTRDEILQRFPAREKNGSAIRLETLCRTLGVEIAPRWEEGHEPPSTNAARAFNEIKGEMARWLVRQLGQPRPARELPPEPVAEYFIRHSAEIETVRRHLVDAELPLWKRRVEDLFAGPLPNLAGHLHLQRLLIADAQLRWLEGDGDAARDDLEASWRLNLPLRDTPYVATLVMSMTVARLQAGAVRQIGVASPEWRDRLAEHDFRESVITALGFEAWLWTQIDDLPLPLLHENPVQRLIASVARPYAEYCVSDVSEAYRRRLEVLKRADSICDPELAAAEAGLPLRVSPWNVIGNMLPTDMTGSLERLASLELDLELTAHLLELRRGRPGTDAKPSTACPGGRWIYETSADGSVTIAFDREITWPNQRGLVLPTRFTTRF